MKTTVSTRTDRRKRLARGALLIRKLSPRSGYDVVALIAMFAALGTGGAYAAATIGSAEVVDNSLTSADVQDLTLRNQDIAPGTIKGGAIENGTIDGPEVKDDSLTGFDINESMLDGSKISTPRPVLTTVFKASARNTDKKKTVWVYCPTGTKAVGTGYDLQGDIDIAVDEQFTFGQGSGVTVSAHTIGYSPYPWELIAQASCVPATFLYSQFWDVWGIAESDL